MGLKLGLHAIVSYCSKRQFFSCSALGNVYQGKQQTLPLILVVLCLSPATCLPCQFLVQFFLCGMDVISSGAALSISSVPVMILDVMDGNYLKLKQLKQM